MIIGIPKETLKGERRVALIPAAIAPLDKAGLEVEVEAGAGESAGFVDEEYRNKGALVISGRKELFEKSDIILQVRSLGANPESGLDDLQLMRPGQVIAGFSEPFTALDAVKALAEKKVTSFSMELIPRITRAQSMDALSSMATVAGYKAVLMAAGELVRMFPMFMTAAGTITPARIFIIGAGVAGLQAIATAKRLGAVVSAYDLRPAVKEQVESLGGRFIELELDIGESEDKGGYAKEMDDQFYKKQREMMAKVVMESDVVITTAAVPGKKAPILITADMVRSMGRGSVLIDLAAERGGNCELTEPGRRIETDGVTIIGPLNLPSTIPYHASQMYAKNISAFLLNMIKEGALKLDMEDEIVHETLVTHDGEIVNERIRALI